jgi:hypothetical protein
MARKTTELRPETKEEREKRHELHAIRMQAPVAKRDAKKRFGRFGGVDYDTSCVDPSVRCRVGTVTVHKLGGGKNWKTLRVKGAGSTWGEAFRDASRQEHDEQQRQKDRELKRAEKLKAAA